MGMKNDLSFLIDDRLSLYEHQSTVNPNMPLRFLLYISDLYSGMTAEENLYGRKTVNLPFPCFVIFYNGAEPQPDRKPLRLSDLYTVKAKRHSWSWLQCCWISTGTITGSCWKPAGIWRSFWKRTGRRWRKWAYMNMTEKSISEWKTGILGRRAPSGDTSGGRETAL